MNDLIIAAMTLGALVLLAIQHTYWSGKEKRTIVACDALLDETRDEMQASHYAEIVRIEKAYETTILRIEKVAGGALADVAMARDALRDVQNLLTVERAYSAACDRQLRTLADQVAGKCLWPTLAADDVVVALPKRVVR